VLDMPSVILLGGGLLLIGFLAGSFSNHRSFHKFTNQLLWCFLIWCFVVIITGVYRGNNN
jgi:hypothetical protein